QLVLKQKRLVVVNHAQHIKNPPVIGEVAAHRPNIDYRIKAIELALARFRVILPAAADVLLVDQLAAGKQRLRFCRKRSDFVRIKPLADDQKSVLVIRADLLWRNVSQRRCGNRHGGARSEWLTSYRQKTYDQMIVRFLVTVPAPRKPPF